MLLPDKILQTAWAHPCRKRCLLAALQAALEAQFFSLDLRDRTRPKQDLWEACGEDTLRGHFLDGLHAQFEAAETDERRQVVARAARLGLALMDGREVPL